MVTTARFLVPDQTYAMNTVSSVRYEREGIAQRFLLVAVFVVGLFLLILSLFATGSGEDGEKTRMPGCCTAFSLLVTLGGGVGAWLSETRHIVTIRTSSGERRALIMNDEKVIRRVIKALNQAIVARG